LFGSIATQLIAPPNNPVDDRTHAPGPRATNVNPTSNTPLGLMLTSFAACATGVVPPPSGIASAATFTVPRTLAGNRNANDTRGGI
jgi:hypothetical protein